MVTNTMHKLYMVIQIQWWLSLELVRWKILFLWRLKQRTNVRIYFPILSSWNSKRCTFLIYWCKLWIRWTLAFCFRISNHHYLIFMISTLLNRNKKRYAGLMWTKVEKFDYMDTKVRKRTCVCWLHFWEFHELNIESTVQLNVLGSRNCASW